MEAIGSCALHAKQDWQVSQAAGTEKQRLLESEIEAQPPQPSLCSRRQQSSRWTLRLQCQLFAGLLIAFAIFNGYFRHCAAIFETTPPRVSFRHDNVQSNVVEPLTSSTLLSPSAGVLEVFQVYQPVLMNAGEVDHANYRDGSSQKAILEASGPVSNCTKLLMEYSFGFSYGRPFVGMSWTLSTPTSVLIACNR
jgi:hypothetical protein